MSMMMMDVGAQIVEAFRDRGMPDALVAIESVPSPPPLSPVWRVSVAVGGRTVGRDFTEDVQESFVLEWARTVNVEEG